MFDLKTRKVIGEIPAIGGQQIMTCSPDDPAIVYYTHGGELLRFDAHHPDQALTSITTAADALGFTWINRQLIVFTRTGTLLRVDPVSKKKSAISCKLPAEPTDITSMALGPDGRIWTGGYLSGGNAAFDPDTGKSEQFRGLSQAEAITTVGSTIYFGLYPGARLSLYDTSKPWNSEAKNPRPFADLGPENQSRPMAMLGVDSLNKVFIGTVPEYGQLGGVLAVYDIEHDKLDVHHDIIAKQSIVSLAFDKGLIVGGSSIFGGLGQQPVEKEAKLFIWEPATNHKTFELVPISGTARSPA